MIYISDISELTCEELEKKVCGERIKYASKYKFEIDRRRSIAVEALLNDALLKEGCIFEYPVGISHLDSGQPYFTDEVIFSSKEKVYFSLSHSGDYVAVAVDSSPIGIDIEKVNEGKNGASIANKFFSETERTIISEDDANRGINPYNFTKIWTLKEAFVKAVGYGLSFGIDSFCVKKMETTQNDFAIAKAESLKLNVRNNEIYGYEQSHDDNTYYGYSLCAPSGYAMSVCVCK